MEDLFMSFRKYCRGISQHTLLVKMKVFKNISVLKKRFEGDTITCSVLRKPFIEYSRPLTATASHHD